MKPLFVATALVAVFASCSKPAQETQTQTDTVAAPTDTHSYSTDRTPVTLTAAEADRVAEELFLAIHDGFTSDRTVLLKEELTFDGNLFKGIYVVHNVDNAGMHSESRMVGSQPTEEEIAAYEADTSEYKMYPQHYEEQTFYTYTPEVDTFYIDAEYRAYEESPEATPRKLTIELGGDGIIHRNEATVPEDGGKPTFAPATFWFVDVEGWSILDTDVLTIDMSEPAHIYPIEQLYVKAKFKDFTEEEFDQISKLDMSFIRNDIFAHHGHTFKTPKMISRYQSQTWYHPVIDDASSLLNKFEKRNVEFLKKKEG